MVIKVKKVFKESYIAAINVSIYIMIYSAIERVIYLFTSGGSRAVFPLLVAIFTRCSN